MKQDIRKCKNCGEKIVFDTEGAWQLRSWHHIKIGKCRKPKPKYEGWESHPQWKDLEEVCGQIKSLKYKSEVMRKKISKEVWGHEC